MPQTKLVKRARAIERMQADLASMKLYFLSINANKEPKRKENWKKLIANKEIHIENTRKNLLARA